MNTNESQPQGEDPYKILGIKPNATDAEIKKAFRKQSKLHHPDKHTGEGPIEQNAHEQQMRRVTWAYALLSNPDERAYYDKHKKERKVRTAETEITPVEKMIIETFGVVFNPVQQDVTKTNYIKLIRLKITDDRMVLRGQIRDFEAGLAQIKKMVGRFTRADDAPGEKNLLELTLETQINDLTATIERTEAEAKLRADTLKELENWNYSVEEGIYRGQPIGFLANEPRIGEPVRIGGRNW